MVNLFLIVVAGICFVWAFLFVIFAGERYMAWTLDREHPERFSLKRFKIVYATVLTLVGIQALYYGICGNVSSPSLFFIVVIGMWILFYTWCKKKDSDR